MGNLAVRVKTLSMLALVLVALGALGYDASSYVQSGLIARWDGIDNAGLGFHYSDATVWKDLKGIYDLALTAKGSWGANFLQVANGCAANYGAKGPTDYLTIEVLYRQPAVLSRYGYLLNSGDKYHYVLIKEDGKTVFFNGSGGVDDIIAYDTLDGEIHAVAAVYSSATAVSAVYTNGVTATGAAGAASYNAGKGWLMLGDRELSATYPWSGEIYAIRLYSEALTPAQIASHCRVPFSWHLFNFHVMVMTEAQVRQWVLAAVGAGASQVVCHVCHGMGTPAMVGKVAAFADACREVDTMFAANATRNDIARLAPGG